MEETLLRDKPGIHPLGRKVACSRIAPPLPGPGTAPLGTKATVLFLMGIMGVGSTLRIVGLAKHFFWFDEGILLNVDELARPGSEYLLNIWHKTTYNPAWALLVQWVTKLGGTTLLTARVPSCIAGVLAIGAVFAAALSLQLDRPTALIAALLTALCWPQVEYAQQILPYAGIPLLTALAVFCVGNISRLGSAGPPLRTLFWYTALASVCTIYVANHNSFIMLLPLLGFSLCWTVSKRRAKRLELGACLVCACWVGLVSFLFFWPKRGEGYRSYLEPYYLATFRTHRMAYGPFLDRFYEQLVPRACRPLDALYFGVSRAYDLLLYGVNLFSPTYVHPFWGLLALGPVSLTVRGLLQAARGKLGESARSLSLGLSGTLAALFALNCLRLYPFGGIRQLLFLTPLVLIFSAAGWRSAARRRPRLCGALTVLGLVVYLVRVPIYYAETSTQLGEREIRAALRRTKVRTLVAPDLDSEYFKLNYLVRKTSGCLLLDTHSPRFGALLRERKPFLMVSSNEVPPLRIAAGRAFKAPGFESITPHWIDFAAYHVDERIARRGGPFRGGQPNPGTFLYSFRPRPDLPPPDPRPIVTALTPHDGVQLAASACREIAIDFSSPLDPRSLGSGAVQLLARPANGVWNPCVPALPTRLVLSAARDRVVLKPAAPLGPNLYLVRIDATVRDQAGRHLAATLFSSFRIAADP